MKDLRCRYCQKVFQPSAYHPQQAVCRQLIAERTEHFAMGGQSSNACPSNVVSASARASPTRTRSNCF